MKENIDELVSKIRTARSASVITSLERKLKVLISRSQNPIVTGDRALFFYFSNPNEMVSLIGDWNKWNPAADPMQRINNNSGLLLCEKQLPIDAGLSYRMAVNGEAKLDPLNKKMVINGPLGENSFFGMSAYSGIPYANTPSKDVLRGKIVEFEVKGNTDIADRKVKVYIPAGMILRGRHRVLYMNDGDDAVFFGRMTEILDNMYYEEPHVSRSIIVFVPPVDRHKEYMLNTKFSKWFATDLTKQVENRLKITSRANMRAVAGASLGGLLSAHIGLHHSNTFRNIIAQSPSFWVNDDEIISAYARKKLLPLRFYLHSGTIADAQRESRAMLTILQHKGYDVTYRETNQSHNWVNWSSMYPEIIRWFVQ